MNKVEILGRLTKDVEVRESKSKGVKYGLFTLAVNRKSNKEQTDFIDCVCFGKLVDIISKYVQKGNRLIVEGELNIDTYQDKEGKNQKSVRVIVNDFYFVDFKKDLVENNAQDELPY